MSLGDCKAPGAVMDGFWVARRVGHGLISPLGPPAWVVMKRSMVEGREGSQWGSTEGDRHNILVAPQHEKNKRPYV
jgi:hypothetical protein